MRSRLVTTIACLLALTLNAAQAGPRDRVPAVERYWEWSAYWGPGGLDFPEAKYRSGRTFRALTFASQVAGGGGPYWGFCSRELGVCQAYFAWADHTVYQSGFTRLRVNESERSALDRFQSQEFLSDEEASGLIEQRDLPRLFLLELPEGHTFEDESSSGNDENHLWTREDSITLPALGLPEAIKRRSANHFVEELIRAQGKGECTVIVPFADSHSPHVPVFSDCPGEKGIQFLRKDDDGWIATAGGWMTDRRTLRRFEPRIRKHASLTVTP